MKMELVDGKSVYEYKDLSLDDKKKILGSIVECLKDVHNLGSIPAEILSYREAYVDKTFKRLEKVYDLVPFARTSTSMGTIAGISFSIEKRWSSSL